MKFALGFVTGAGTVVLAIAYTLQNSEKVVRTLTKLADDIEDKTEGEN